MCRIWHLRFTVGQLLYTVCLRPTWTYPSLGHDETLEVRSPFAAGLLLVGCIDPVNLDSNPTLSAVPASNSDNSSGVSFFIASAAGVASCGDDAVDADQERASRSL